jgi:hypothetical protein
MTVSGEGPGDAIDLTAAIDAVHRQLTDAIRNVRENDVLGFEYGNVEIELQMAATKDSGIEGGVRFYVFTAGGKASKGSSATHRIKINIKPYKPGTDEAARVSGPPARVMGPLDEPPA